MELPIQERLRDLYVERELTLERFGKQTHLGEQTHLSRSALGSYETEDFKDISHHALIRLAKFYGETVDYLLGLSKAKNYPGVDLVYLRLGDDIVGLLKTGLADNSLLCKVAAHSGLLRPTADLKIYMNGITGKQV